MSNQNCKDVTGEKWIMYVREKMRKGDCGLRHLRAHALKKGRIRVDTGRL